MTGKTTDHNENKIQLSVGLLVSNRIDYIERVLDGIKPLLETLDSELIIVDTVGPENTDGSIEVAKRYTDMIYRFEWCNDFAKARNVCIEHATGEWFMYLDDDEVFEDVGEIVEFFKSGEYRDYEAAMYHLKNHLPDGSERMSVVLRLIRLRPNTCFVGRIHEGFNEIYEPCKLFDAFVHHYGYMLTNEESVRKHQERNLSIIREEIAGKGLNAGIASQLVQELIFTKGTEEEGLKELEKCLEQLSEKELSTANGQWLLTAGVSYCYNLGKHEEALAEDKRTRSEYRLNETARLVLSATCIYSAAHLEKAAECVDYAKEYATIYDFLRKNEKIAIRQMNLGSESYRQKEYASSVLFVGAHASIKCGRFDEGLRLLICMYEFGCEPGEGVSEIMEAILKNAEDENNKRKFRSFFLSEEGMKAYGY